MAEQIACGRSLPFVDDVGVRPCSRSYFLRDGVHEEVLPGVRRYVIESIVSLDEVLADIERSGGTISRENSEFLKDGVKMVAFVCSSAGRTPDEVKARKIVDWKPCRSVTEAKGFLGICVYYRIWIRNFAMRTDPIYRLT